MNITLTHIPNTLLPLQDGLHVEAMDADGEVLTITLTATAPVACCPLCATPSSRVHSQYQRHPTDLPWGSFILRLVLCARRFRCPVRDCPRRIFTERLPHLLRPYARRTARAQDIVRAVALALGGEAGARLIARLHLRLSASTLRRLIRRLETPVPTPPRVIGVDDFALRRRQRYGTVIADLEEHKIIDLLPDRTAPTLAAWLRQQPQIEIVSRDRATEYARGITEGAPQAVQVADRWHVLRNLREATERVLDAQRAQWQDITLPEATDRVPPVRRSRHEQVARQARREQRRERYAAVRALHAQGMPLLQIARRLQMGRATVRRYVTADVFPERAPSAPTQPPPPLCGLSGTALGRGLPRWRPSVEGYPGPGLRRIASHGCSVGVPTTPRTRPDDAAQIPSSAHRRSRLPENL